MTNKCGAQPIYADIAIETALSLRLLFHLPLLLNRGFSWLGFAADWAWRFPARIIPRYRGAMPR